MLKLIRFCLALLIFGFTLWTGTAEAGISSVNVLVAANRNNKESMQIALHYMKTRNIPRSHFIFLDIPEKFIIKGKEFSSLTDIDYKNYVQMIETPIKRKLSEPGLQGRIHAIVFSKWIPFRVKQNPRKPWRSGVTVSLVLERGENPGYNTLFGRNNGFCYSDEILHPPIPMLFYLAGWDLNDVTALIDRSAAADSTFPKGTFYLLEGDGPRGVRKRQIPSVVKIAEIKGIPVKAFPGSKLLGAQDILGYHTGTMRVKFQGNRMLPGSIGDHLTSFGGKLYDKESGQMSILDYIHNGASMTYGTVFEPTNNPALHVDLSCVIYYGSGFTAGEAYAFNVRNITYAVFVGDPMTAPFAPLPTLEEKEPGTYLIKATDPEANILRIELWQNGKFARNVFEPTYEEGDGFYLGGTKGSLVFSFKAGESLASFLQRSAESLQKVLASQYTVSASPSYLSFVPVSDNLQNREIGKLGLAKDGPIIFVDPKAPRIMKMEFGNMQWKFFERGNPSAEVTLKAEDLAHKDVYLNVICANQPHSSKSFLIPPPGDPVAGKMSSVAAETDSP